METGRPSKRDTLTKEQGCSISLRIKLANYINLIELSSPPLYRIKSGGLK